MKTRFPLYFLLLPLLLCLVSPQSGAQNSPTMGRTSIRGQVRDAKTHAWIKNVIVTIEDQSAGSADQRETDSSGKFDFEGIYPSVYIVKIRVPGYQEASERLDLTVSGSNFVDFELQSIPGDARSQGPSEGIVNIGDAAIPEKARKEFEKGRQLMLDGKDLQGSVDHLQKATKIYPQFADAYLLMGMVYIQKNDPASAKASLQKAVEVDPKLSAGYITQGMLFNGLKDYPSAEKSLTQGLQLNPESADGHYELAKTYWATGRLQDAEQQATKAAAVKPDLAPVHVLLGNIELRKNDPAGALKEFQEYLKLDPNGQFANGTKTLVDKLQKSLGVAQ